MMEKVRYKATSEALLTWNIWIPAYLVQENV